MQAIHDSARVVGQPYEIIVVDDASTDATAEIARQNNATVLPVNHRQIAATRNSGARAAHGERLFFVDADTTINPRVVASALRYMDKGAAGGGAMVRMEGNLPLYIQLLSFLSPIIVMLAKLAGFTGGAFMFCTRNAFTATGGFNEKLYWSEEGDFAMALKREGRFIVLWERVLTSGRRFNTMSGLQMLAICARTALFPRKMLTQRSSVEKVWYDSNRDNDNKIPKSLAFKMSNTIAFLILFVMISNPLWNFIPRSLTPLTSPVGKIRLGIGIFMCHVGLVLWSVAFIFLKNLLRKNQWIEEMKLAVLTGLCLWQAWGATQGVIWFWTQFSHWFGAL